MEGTFDHLWSQLCGQISWVSEVYHTLDLRALDYGRLNFVDLKLGCRFSGEGVGLNFKHEFRCSHVAFMGPLPPFQEGPPLPLKLKNSKTRLRERGERGQLGVSLGKYAIRPTKKMT